MDFVKRRSLKALLAAGVMTIALAHCLPAFANNYGEDESWAFETPADQANMSVVQDMIQKKQADMYKSPVYSTVNIVTTNNNIAHQNNCGVSSTVYGNYGTNAQGGNSPSETGPTLTATGNQNASSVSQDGVSPLPVNLSTGQSNTGQVGTTYAGNLTGVTASGTVNQAMNSAQKNGGTQTASVAGSTACSGALN